MLVIHLYCSSISTEHFSQVLFLLFLKITFPTVITEPNWLHPLQNHSLYLRILNQLSLVRNVTTASGLVFFPLFPVMISAILSLDTEFYRKVFNTKPKFLPTSWKIQVFRDICYQQIISFSAAV